MQWFEPIIALAAIILVILPIITSIKNQKKGKTSCGCTCKDCSKKDVCYQNFKQYMNEYHSKKLG